MIAELAAGVGGLAAVAGWIFAFRARGESQKSLGVANAAAERERIASARADAAQAKAQDSEAIAVAAGVELKATLAERDLLANELATERRAKADLLVKLAKAGAPVGPVLVDDALDRLHAHGNQNDRGPAPRDEGSHGEPVSDPATGDPGGKSSPR